MCGVGMVWRGQGYRKGGAPPSKAFLRMILRINLKMGRGAFEL